jgi:hypothetical protein
VVSGRAGDLARSVDRVQGKALLGVELWAEIRRLKHDPRPQGVALAADLLNDTAGPLYNPDADERIEDAARRASDALERPVPPVARAEQQPAHRLVGPRRRCHSSVRGGTERVHAVQRRLDGPAARLAADRVPRAERRAR